MAGFFGVSITQLDSYSLQEIFKYLDLKDLLSVYNTCRRLRCVVKEHGHNYKMLVGPFLQTRVSDVDMAHLLGMVGESLSVLDTSQIKMSKNCEISLVRLIARHCMDLNILKLHFRHSHATFNGTLPPALLGLDLTMYLVSDEEAKRAIGLNVITVNQFGMCDVQKAHGTFLRCFRNLKEFYLRSSRTIQQDELIAMIKRNRRIEIFLLYYCCHITEEILKPICKYLINLTELIICCRSDPQKIFNFRWFEHLQKLKLLNYRHGCSGPFVGLDILVQSISKLKKLEILKLDGNQYPNKVIQPATREAFLKLTKLKEITLINCEFIDQDVLNAFGNNLTMKSDPCPGNHSKNIFRFLFR